MAEFLFSLREQWYSPRRKSSPPHRTLPAGRPLLVGLHYKGYKVQALSVRFVLPRREAGRGGAGRGGAGRGVAGRGVAP